MAVIQEACIGGVSTRRIDELVQAMGLTGIPKSTVSKLCKEIDERVRDFLHRPLEGEWPYLWLDASCLKVRQGGRIVSVAAIVAVAVNTDGRRENIGLGLGPSEAETFWTEFLRGMKGRAQPGAARVMGGRLRRIRVATGAEQIVDSQGTQGALRRRRLDGTRILAAHRAGPAGHWRARPALQA